MDGTTLTNKSNLWQSNDDWFIREKDEWVIVENHSNSKVLEATDYHKVMQEKFDENKTEQFWKKGKANTEGFFILIKYGSNKVLTAISATDLTVKGKYIDKKNNKTYQ